MIEKTYLHKPLNIIFAFAILSVTLQLAFNHGYGIFRDEMYYIANGEHLAFGYVDHPPLIGLIGKFITLFLGKSLFAIRLLPALAGAGTVFISGLIIREAGGKSTALIFGLTAVVFAPVLLALSSTLSMNPFDVLFSTIIILFLFRALKTDSRKNWICFGIAAGIALLNKISFMFIGFGLIWGLLLTENRKHFANRNFYYSLITAGVIFLPHVVWQIVNGYPTLEFVSNAAQFKNVSFSPLAFIGLHILDLHPNNLIFLLPFIWILFSKQLSELKIFVWIYAAVILFFSFSNAKPYYMSILIPMMLAFGAVAFEKLTETRWKRIHLTALYALLIPAYLGTVPFALPVLSPENYIAYSRFTGIAPAPEERHDQSPLPQYFADRFGWEDLARDVSEIYTALSDSEKTEVLVFGQNYGEAGAIDYFRGEYDLPPAVSSHNSYWLWGIPSDRSGSTMIVIGSNFEDNARFFEEVTEVKRHYNKYGMPYENVGIFLCRKPKVKLSDVWDRLKSFN